MTTPQSPLVRAIQFLGKVQFTTFLLLGGAVIMTVGTVLESRGSREIAWSAVYGTAWFDIFLFLIGINLIISVINRIPIKRHQWPFVVTHFSIVILLAGAWISRTYGYEGRLFVYEGSSENRLFLDGSAIQVRWTPGPGANSAGEVIEANFPLSKPGQLAEQVLSKDGESGPSIRIAEYVPDGVLGFEFQEGGAADPPGVEFTLSSAGQQLQHWLIAGDPRFARQDLRALEVELLRIEPGEEQAALMGSAAQGGAQSAEIPLPAKPRIAVLLGPANQLYLRASSPAGVMPAIPVMVGQSASLAGVSMRVDRLVANAIAATDVKPAPLGSTGDGEFVRLEATANGTPKSLWLAHTGNFQALNLDGAGKLEAAFGPQRREVPFRIALEEFEVVHYPGSSRPAEYRSRVRVESSTAEFPPHDEVISMNRPLDVADFRLFQSSYKLGERGEPDATILSVAYDPGVPIVYASFFLLIFGIAWGLRGVSLKLEQPTRSLAGQRAAPAASNAERNHAPRDKKAAAAQRSGARNVALLFAVLAGFAATPDASAQSGASQASIPVDATRGWAILADGRVKPLVTYAKELTLAVTGREKLDGLSALEILWGYSLNPQVFMDRPYVRVDSLEVKAKLGLPASEKRFSLNGLVRNEAFQQLVKQALDRQERDQPLSRLDNDALETYGKLQRLASLASGDALAIAPIVDADGSWAAPVQLSGAEAPDAQAVREGFGRLVAAYASGNAEAFGREAAALTLALRNLNPSAYPSQSAIDRELFYEDFNAFGKAWVLYLAGFLAILLFGFSERPWGYAAGMAFITAGFICQSIGLGTRWVIADRAPVSNMYESLVFMGWGAIAIGLVPEFLYRKRFLALAAGLMGFMCLAFAENLPINPAIDPLVPVLAHTYWLSVHVMTVMLSYSAFAVAMVLGHVMLLVELVFQKQRIDLLTSLSKLLYKTLQVGILFLAAGIIFGAIWANESWGRYWGWDPKETWSLITFFVYLAIVHARFAGWLRHFGLAASAILGFLAVVMTYYGVNFILAAGMHAYGFSEGGQIYVGIYAAAELAIIAAAWVRYGNVKLRVSQPSDESA